MVQELMCGHRWDLVLPGWVALRAWQSSSNGHAMAPSDCLWRERATCPHRRTP
jgi:hypothetical protein